MLSYFSQAELQTQPEMIGRLFLHYKIRTLPLIVFLCLGVAQSLKATDRSQSETQTEVVQNSVTESGEQSKSDQKKGEEQSAETCRLVIKISLREPTTASVSALQRDIEAGVFADYALDITKDPRLPRYPKIRVPSGPKRALVWYGYNSQVRKAVLKTAAAGAAKIIDSNQNVSVSQSVDETEIAPEKSKYPLRSNWWTVNGRYPEREAMIEHMSSKSHAKKFDHVWLQSLSRGELHALHSDDHEGRLNLKYVVGFEHEENQEK